MKKKGKDLIFISQIMASGLARKIFINMNMWDDEIFNLIPLDKSHETYIAQSGITFVVKLK